MFGIFRKLIPDPKRKCTLCLQRKPTSEYYKYSRHNQLSSYCKPCHRLYNRRNYLKKHVVQKTIDEGVSHYVTTRKDNHDDRNK